MSLCVYGRPAKALSRHPGVGDFNLIRLIHHYLLSGIEIEAFNASFSNVSYIILNDDVTYFFKLATLATWSVGRLESVSNLCCSFHLTRPLLAAFCRWIMTY